MWIEGISADTKQIILLNSDKVICFGTETRRKNGKEYYTINTDISENNYYSLGLFETRESADNAIGKLIKMLTNNYSYHRVIGDDEG